MSTMMNMTDTCHNQVISIEDVGFSYEGQTVLRNVNFTVYERDFEVLSARMALARRRSCD